jgi:NAD(P)-dependent dehydrogenase (short-subunit alcohol dehydrogenase family)
MTKPSKRPIADQVVVITGASSGIGRATALAFAQRGASVVIAARGEEALGTLEHEIRQLGRPCLAVPTDVADWQQVRALAVAAVERFGRIDTWVNDAAVSAWATVEQLTVEEIEQVIRVDLLGAIHGMKAALEVMGPDSPGTIINVGSVEAKRAFPLQAPYTAAKHGLKAFSDSLRMELQHGGRGVDVVLIHPAGINTPLFRHARSKLGVMARPAPPVYEPESVAEAIVFAAEHPRREIYVGGAGKLLELVERLSPALTDRLMTLGGLAFRVQEGDRPEPARDNLHAPTEGTGRVHGDFGDEARRSLYTPAVELRPRAQLALLAAAALVVLGLWRARR